MPPHRWAIGATCPLCNTGRVRYQPLLHKFFEADGQRREWKNYEYAICPTCYFAQWRERYGPEEPLPEPNDERLLMNRPGLSEEPRGITLREEMELLAQRRGLSVEDILEAIQ